MLRHKAMILAALILLGGGICASGDPDEAEFEAIRTQAEKGSAKYEMQLATAYLMGHGVKRDERVAAFWYEKAAHSGDPAAQVEIGYLYQSGTGVAKDAARAVYWYRRASASGSTSAKVNLGVAYIWGVGVDRNPARGLELLKKAAERGNERGAAYVGEVYHLGVGVPQDDDLARQWYERGIKLHSPLAMFRIAELLLADGGRSHPCGRAVDLLRRSAKEGLVSAKDTLGALLAARQELARSPQEATSLLKDAAAAGMWRSSAVLGVLARDGTWLARDPGEAYFWFRVAKLQGRGEADRYLESDFRCLTASLGEEKVAQIEGRADAWFKEHSVALQYVSPANRKWAELPSAAIAVPEAGDYAGELLPAPQ